MNLNKYVLYFLLLTLLASTSCTHLMHLDRAQNNFNRGATLENQLKFEPQANVSTPPSIYYTLAYAELEKALGNKKGLNTDNVLASTYSIKALCEWKLKLYEKAENSADDALQELKKMREKGIRLPRDKALMEALPHLMEIDRVKDTLDAFHTPPPTFQKGKEHYLDFIFEPDTNRMARLERAIHEIAKVQASVATNEELSTYFVLAQLSALKTWSDALDYLLTCIREDASLTTDNPTARKKARTWKSVQGDEFLDDKEKQLLEQLRTLLPTEKGRELADYWDTLIGG